MAEPEILKVTITRENMDIALGIVLVSPAETEENILAIRGLLRTVDRQIEDGIKWP